MTTTTDFPLSAARTTVVDADKRDAFVESLVRACGGAFQIFALYLGDRLGYYDALASGEALSSTELAERSSTAERYAREWLEQQCVTGVVEAVNPEADERRRRYRLPAEHAEALTQRESLNYIAPLGQLIAGAVRPLDQIVEAHRSGGGVPFSAYGRDLREGQALMNRAMFLYQLGLEWLPSISDIDARLRSDPSASIADIGCGYGYSAIGMARAYPKVRVDGFDLDADSVEQARVNAEAYDLDGRVRFEARDAGDPGLAGRYELVTAFECVHDMSNPVEVLGAARRMLAPGGSMIVADERVEETFTPDGGELDWMMYGWSILHCLPVGMSEKPSCCTGTVMRPSTLERYAREAGFKEFEILPIENYFLRFYRLR